MDVAMSTELVQNHRGLKRFMLRMPALRDKLQMLSTRKTEFFNLCGAFDEAVTTLERLREGSESPDPLIIAEYESICIDIESEIVRICERDG